MRVQDTNVYQATDPQVLAWAAQEHRLLTHDVDTMTKFANQRIEQGLFVAGVIFVRDTLPVSKAIEDLLTIAGASDGEEWENRTDFLPL